MTLRVEYSNEGSDPALDASLIITLPTALQNATLLDAVSVPDLNLDKATPAGCDSPGHPATGPAGGDPLFVEGGRGRVPALLRLANGTGYMKLGDIKGELRSSSPDADSSNNARSQGGDDIR